MTDNLGWLAIGRACVWAGPQHSHDRSLLCSLGLQMKSKAQDGGSCVLWSGKHLYLQSLGPVYIESLKSFWIHLTACL